MLEGEDREDRGRRPADARRTGSARSIDDNAVETYERAVDEAKKNGTVVSGGERLTDGEYAKGTFVAPTVVEVPLDSWVWKEELFVPFVSVAPSTTSTRRSGSRTTPSTA